MRLEKERVGKGKESVEWKGETGERKGEWGKGREG